MAKIKAFASGGLDEIGKNLFVIEVDEDIFIFDCGSKSPKRESLGIDTIIPDFTYIKQNKNRIKAIFITKPAEDSIGALPYLLKDVKKIKIYASSLATFMIKLKLKTLKVKFDEENILAIKPKTILKFGPNEVEIFQTTSSIPGSYGFALRTVDGTIVYTGDYIFDSEAKNKFGMDLQHLVKIAQDKILLLLSESGYASRISFTAPNHKISRWVEQVFKNRKARLILGCYEQDLYKINEMIELSAESKRKYLSFYGKILNEILTAANKENYLSTKQLKILPLEKCNDLNGDQQPVIFVTGTGELLYVQLIKIATDNTELKIDSNDIFVLSSPPESGNELSYAMVLDELARTDAKVISISDKQIWDIKASYEDIKLMVNIMKPVYFMPVKSLHKNFVSARAAAIEAGVLSDNVLIRDNGQVLEFNDGKLEPTKFNAPPQIVSNSVYVDGIGVGDVGSVVLTERAKLSREGVIIVGVTIDRDTKEIISLIDVQMRGVIYIQENSSLVGDIQKKIEQIINIYRKKQDFDLAIVKKEIILKISDICRQQTAKSPIILAIINEFSDNNKIINNKVSEI